MEDFEKQNLNEEDKNDVFTTPFTEKKEEKKTSFLEKFKGLRYKKLFYIIISIIFLIIVLILLFKRAEKDLLRGEIKSVRNYSTGLESNIESFLFYLHNNEPLPDSVKFYFDKVLYIEFNLQETCGLKRIKELLFKRGFVHSIVIETKTYKDLDIYSWIYRTNFIEGNYVNAEYIIDFEFKNDTIYPKSFELLSETKKQEEVISIPSKDTVIKKKKKETEIIIIDSVAKSKVDSAKKRNETKIEEKEIKQDKIKEDKIDEDKNKGKETKEEGLIQKKEQGKEDKPKENEEK